MGWDVPRRARHRSTCDGLGMVIDRFEGGKIKDMRIIMDTLGLMMQLGAVQPAKA